ncbi:endoplasmic reticulum junction formation protein lunapark isoform X3 [Vombatus ursinus]|uniref:endoplasmic reticulum junction formation protein lunapark isoform X3 n=1 Tax=Vombatus ursinus TaxID=29139 RepID=UPI000FFD24E9|nr:endoplasmic reticulum junction formation protein lunapark isoform X3 [Vombatus ursinus]
MGGLFSRWRAKPSTVEVLENIDKEIQALEEFREKNQRLQKLWVGRLLLYSSLLYLFTCIVVYLWYLPDEFTARLTMTLPFFAFPLIIWTIRTALIFFFSKRTERNNEALDDLKSQKKKILEEVMEKETYKTAKLILERFDPESRKAKELEPSSLGAAAIARPGQEIRQRTTAQRNLSPSTPASPNQGSPLQVPGSPGPQKDTSAPGGPPERAGAPALQSNVLPRRLGSPATSVPGMGLHPPGPPLARPILPRERGALDRIVEYLVGDGPQNRYALICQQCFSHNGMALKEEFEYIESLEEQDVAINYTNQTDEKASDTEQTSQTNEKASGPTEQEDSIAGEAESKETTVNEAKSTNSNADSTAVDEPNGESLMEIE